MGRACAGPDRGHPALRLALRPDRTGLRRPAPACGDPGRPAAPRTDRADRAALR